MSNDQPMSEDELRKKFETNLALQLPHLSPRQRTVIALMAVSGLREHETVVLTWGDLR